MRIVFAWECLLTRPAIAGEPRKTHGAIEISAGFRFYLSPIGPGVGTPAQFESALDIYRQLAYQIQPAQTNGPDRIMIGVPIAVSFRPAEMPLWLGVVYEPPLIPGGEISNWSSISVQASSVTGASTRGERTEFTIYGTWPRRAMLRIGYDFAGQTRTLVLRPEIGYGVAWGEAGIRGFTDIQATRKGYSQTKNWAGETYEIGLLLGTKVVSGKSRYLRPWIRVDYAGFPGDPAGGVPEISGWQPVSITIGSSAVF